MADSSKDATKQKTNALGIMGGTFDPIHVGHLKVAEVVRSKLALDRIVFVPAYCPPHKSISDITPVKHRFAMVSEAIAGNSRFEVSGIERGYQCPVYVGDTIRAFKEMEGDDRNIYFITGLDAILIIINWHQARTYPGLCQFVAVTRPGYDKGEIESRIPDDFRSYITIVEEPSLSVSSSEIRHRVKTGQSIEDMVPKAVKDYICRHGLYV
ncbi:MAG: nicotinate-nucleotide adenylyltransferase [Syntrophales bacterium]|jgi:nicotinate-nucleotide adenylyltransferase